MLIPVATTFGTQSLAIVPAENLVRQTQHDFRTEQLVKINAVSLHLEVFIGQVVLRLKLTHKCVPDW